MRFYDVPVPLPTDTVRSTRPRPLVGTSSGAAVTPQQQSRAAAAATVAQET